MDATTQPRWVIVDEIGNDNFATSIYEAGDKDLLVARCNQNGQYPWQAPAIVRGLEVNKSANRHEPMLLVEEVAAHLDLRGDAEGCTFPAADWVWCSEGCREHARCLKSMAADLRAALNGMEG